MASTRHWSWTCELKVSVPSPGSRAMGAQDHPGAQVSLADRRGSEVMAALPRQTGLPAP